MLRDKFFFVIKYYLIKNLIYVFLLPLVLVLRILNIFINIRLGGIDISSFGRLICFEYYLAKKKVNKKKTYDIIYCYTSLDKVSNNYIRKFWSKKFFLFPFGNFLEKINELNLKFPGYYKNSINFGISKDHVLYPNEKNLEDKFIYEFKKNKNPVVTFSEMELDYGNKTLKQIGVSPKDKIIIFHNRDSSFLKGQKKDRDWSYHDYRDSNPQEMLKSMEYLANKGFKVFRCGKTVNQHIVTKNNNIIDYPLTNIRSDFMDFFLAYRSDFLVCGDSGFSNLAVLFKKPLVSINHASISRVRSWINYEIKLFKKFYYKKTNKILSIKEIINYNLHRIGRTEEMDKTKFFLVENSEEEILNSVKEMEQSLMDNWLFFKKNFHIQEKFWNNIGYEKPPENIYISNYFLKNNDGLLN